MTTTNDDQFYCNQKFWYLTVNLEKNHLASCCSASPQKINLEFLKQKPGELFNSPDLLRERELMLANQPVESCRSSCWEIEAEGKQSRRLQQNGNVKTHTNKNAQVETLNIITGSDCNLTCVYCCKFYSSAWSRDVLSAPYEVPTDDDRFVTNSTDLILQKISQKDLNASVMQQSLLNEIHKLYKSPSLKKVWISGGEPFLYLNLADIVKNIPNAVDLSIWTGLGVDEVRFAKELDKMPDGITLVVSAENIGSAYEFARFGNSWKRFENNLNQIVKRGIAYTFNSTITNLTIFGLSKFVDYAGKTPIEFSLCTNPNFLSVEVLDESIKDTIDLANVPEFVKTALFKEPTPAQCSNFKSYIKEFTSRREIDLASISSTLANWATS